MLPLSTLLSRVLSRLRTEAQDGIDEGMPSLAVWANVLRCLDNGDLGESALPDAARVSKRLASAAVTTVTNAGWIAAQPAGGKLRTLMLTDAGAKATQAWRERLEELDRSWVGAPLRGALESIVGRLPFELPHFPASYGSADPSAIGGPYVQQIKRKDGLPAHGNDWRPVLRGDGDTLSSLPITALISQALMAFTIDYEDKFPWPLHSTANVLVHIGTTPTPLSKLPAKHGITGKGKSLLERHLIASVTERGVALTERGELILKHHPVRLDATEAIWRERHGDRAVDALRRALDEPASKATEEPAHIIWSASP